MMIQRNVMSEKCMKTNKKKEGVKKKKKAKGYKKKQKN